MSEREEYRVAGLPEPVNHYTDAVRAGDLLFVSGCLPVDEDGRLVGGDVAAQARQVLANMGQILAAAGASSADVARVTIYMLNVGEQEAIKPMREQAFRSTRPASTLIEVRRLAVPGARIEIDAVARLK
jgi:2-iminobutanoate/2-iminopropanoate deaminase